MTAEIWFRNVKLAMRELVECREAKLVFDGGTIAKSRIAFPGFIEMFYPEDLPWRALVLDDVRYEALEYSAGMTGKPIKYPYWDATEHELFHLEGWASENPYVPILVPGVKSEYKEQLLREIADIQKEYPDCKILFHNATNISRVGLGLGAYDFDPRTEAAHDRCFCPDGKILLPASKKITPDNKWLKILGFHASDLAIPRMRCMWNIKAAAWAGEYYTENINLRTRATKVVDYKSKVNRPAPLKTPKVTLPRDPEKRPAGDYFLCNSCGLQNKCDFFRRGAVCSVPGSEPTELSKYFGTRDSDMILDGLSNLLQFQANRVMQAAEEEAASGEIDPELTKMVNGLFDRGVKMAKLVDPALGAKPAVGVFVGTGVPSPGIPTVNAKTILSGIVRELEARGIPRDQITPEMLQGILTQSDQKAAIEGTVISSKKA